MKKTLIAWNNTRIIIEVLETPREASKLDADVIVQTALQRMRKKLNHGKEDPRWQLLKTRAEVEIIGMVDGMHDER